MNQLTKLVTSYLSILLKWKVEWKLGKSLLDQIIQIKEETNETFRKELSESLQEKCNELRDIAIKFTPLVTQLGEIQEKIEASIGLLNTSCSFLDSSLQDKSLVISDSESQIIEEAVLTIFNAYKEQSKMMMVVSEDIGHCANSDEVIFHAAVWMHQPGTKCTKVEFLLLKLHRQKKNWVWPFETYILKQSYLV